MTSAISLVAHDDSRFPYLLDELISETRFNPIYSPRFDPYYIETSSCNSKNLSMIISKNNKPVFAMLLCERLEETGEVYIDYLGRIAAIISKGNCEFESALQHCKLFLRLSSENQQSWPFRKNILLRGSLLLNNTAIVSTPIIEEIVRKAQRAETRFMRLIDLTDQEMVIKSNFSKSVKSVLKEKKNDEFKINIVNSESSTEAILNAVRTLRLLHLESAGRETRSLKSWEIQATQISVGCAFIVEMLSNNKVISSAYFMNTESDCYYGVSASQKTHKRTSYSHACLVKAIDYSKSKGFRFFHLGEQLSELSHSVSEKELNIEKFKSFFGGFLTLEILFRI